MNQQQELSPQCRTLLSALESGQTLTVAAALSSYGVYALSQRMGELRRLGYPVKSELVKVGARHVARYSLEPRRAA